MYRKLASTQATIDCAKSIWNGPEMTGAEPTSSTENKDIDMDEWSAETSTENVALVIDSAPNEVSQDEISSIHEISFHLISSHDEIPPHDEISSHDEVSFHEIPTHGETSFQHEILAHDRHQYYPSIDYAIVYIDNLTRSMGN